MAKQRNPPCNTPKERSCAELSLTTYLPQEKILAVLNDKLADGQLYQAITIFHDRDVNEDGTLKAPHSHVYVRLARSRMPSQIRNWFRGLDEKGQLVNTFSEPIKSSVYDLRLYFLHRNAPEKYQYNESDLFEIGDPLTVNEGIDETYAIFMDLADGVAIPDLIRKYGRDFVYHYTHWRKLMEDYNFSIQQKENEKKWKEASNELFGLKEVSDNEIRSLFETD